MSGDWYRYTTVLWLTLILTIRDQSSVVGLRSPSDGFEPSGRMHIAQGVMKALNVNKLTAAGCHFKFW